MRLLAALFAVTLGGAGCSIRIAHLAAAAPTPAPAGLTHSKGPHTGRSCRWWILGVPLGLPHIEEAMNDALARGQGRLLRDVTILSVHPVYALFGQHCYEITGDVID